MANPTPPIISPVLKEAAELKFDELNRAKELFKNRYHGNPAIIAAGTDTLKRASALLDEIKKLDPYLEHDCDLEILTRFLEQGKNDRSISQAKLLKFEKQLLDKLSIQAHRLDVSSLHVDLLKEVMYVNTTPLSAALSLEKAVLDDDFEVVESELDSVFEKFEKCTFRSKDVDTDALEKLLSSLFKNGPDGSCPELQYFREDLEVYGDGLLTGSIELDNESLEWCIKDLLERGLLNEGNKKTLQGYLQSPVALRELRSTLNMKSVRHWNWRNATKGLPVTAMKNSEGKFCITVEEDILDMVFLHSLAMGWSRKLWTLAKRLVQNPHIWDRNTTLTSDEFGIREYYLLGPRMMRKAPIKQICTVCHVTPPPPPPPPPPMGPPPPPMMCPPPPPPPPPIWNGKPAKKPKKNLPPPPPPAPWTGQNLNEERHTRYVRDFLLCRLPQGLYSWDTITPAGETQEKIIKILATELKIREAFDGKAAQVNANFKSFASSLPHKTILTILKFMGMPQIWLEVFTRFLEAPLNMGPVVRGTSDQVITRSAGVPIAHGLELFFGEAVLFFLDFLVHSRTGGHLLRRRDQCYFVGSVEQCALATAAITEFANVCQLEVEFGDAAQLSIGCLNFVGNDCRDWSAQVNYDKVEACARRVKKQLDTCSTVLDWIRTWNSTAGVYAAHLFGPLANVFGKTHVTAVTQAYNRVHQIIFEGSNLTDYVKKLLIEHIRPNLSDPPFSIEPLLYLPTAYGGLGLKNPYVTLNLVGEFLDPQKRIKEFLDSEKKYYDQAKSSFEAMTAEQRKNKLENIFFRGNDSITAAFGDRDTSVFMTFQELVSHREKISYCHLPYPSLHSGPVLNLAATPTTLPLYTSLMCEPVEKILNSDRVYNSLRSNSNSNGKKNWWNHSPEDQWVLQMYSDECFERYGGMEIWHADCVPLEILKMVRGEEDDDDDDYSISDVTDA